MIRLIPILVVLCCCCVSAQQQGVHGKIYWLEGNLMPGPDKPSTQNQGIKRTLEIFQALYPHDVQAVNGQFYTTKKEPIAIVESDKKGNFKIQLPPGHYSLLSRETFGLYANRFDASGCINCFEVKPNHFTWHTLSIDFEAAY